MVIRVVLAFHQFASYQPVSQACHARWRGVQLGGQPSDGHTVVGEQQVDETELEYGKALVFPEPDAYRVDGEDSAAIRFNCSLYQESVA